MFGNQVWKAQYSNITDLPSSAGAWQLDEVAESLRKMKLAMQYFQCINRESAHWFDSEYIPKSRNMHNLSFSTIEADELPAYHCATFVGSNTLHRVSCDALLVGQKAQIRLSTIEYATLI